LLYAGATRGQTHGTPPDEAAPLTQCFDSWLSEEEAAASIDVGPYRAWVAADRLAPNVKRAYGEFRGDLAAPPTAAGC
jgi:hypothetical protein